MAAIFRGKKEYFPGISRISFEGANSDNPLSFKFYDETKLVAGISMKDHLRFAVAYWHSFVADGSDPFGLGTITRKWNQSNEPLKVAEQRADAAFEFMTKLGIPYYCFHDVDTVLDNENVLKYEKNVETVTTMLQARQEETGIKLLWNTANLFSHPRYMNGAATNPNFQILARAAVQVKAMLEANVRLNGSNYVFWGGREGYTQLFNTNMKRELNHMARFLMMARDYGREIGFQGTFLIEPKPMEPSKHQYDSDAAAAIAFLKTYDLDGDFKLNIEANHATLAGKSFAHDLQVASDAGLMGSIDANRGDPQNGWDTDQFPNDIYDNTAAMLIVLQNGGLHNGGLNFDAKLRRNSTDVEDLFYAHIGGMDSFALSLEIADTIISRGLLKRFRDARYESFDSGKGKEFEKGMLTLGQLRDIASETKEIMLVSGKQELIENVINQIIFTMRS